MALSFAKKELTLVRASEDDSMMLIRAPVDEHWAAQLMAANPPQPVALFPPPQATPARPPAARASTQVAAGRGVAGSWRAGPGAATAPRPTPPNLPQADFTTPHVARGGGPMARGRSRGRRGGAAGAVLCEVIGEPIKRLA